MMKAGQPSPHSTLPILMGIFALCAAAGAGGWYWLQAPVPGSPVEAPGTSGPEPRVARDAAPPAAPTPASAGQVQSAASDEPAPAARPAETAPPAAAASTGRRAGHAARIAAKPAAEPAGLVRIATATARPDPHVASAYRALMEGDLTTAQHGYEQALNEDPGSIDALHGLAAISLRQGRPGAAEDYYLRILEADPKDAGAQAGLSGFRSHADPIRSESRLKILLAEQPDSPFPSFALGNLYARQGRWSEAQQAYFRACSADADNPDYQFNLAISLEQLRQPGLALRHYRDALAAAARRPAAFDRHQAAARVRALQQ